MASEKYCRSADAVKSSAKSCSFDGDSSTAERKNKGQSVETGTSRRTVRCIDCQKKFDGWRMLQRHRRKSCPKSSLRFFCRECKAFFPSKVDLKSHISAAHTGNDKHSKKLQKRKSAKAAKRDRKVEKRRTVGKNTESDKEIMETCTVGSNPFCFTTSCAPDAQSFQFLCQSCLTVRFATYIELREHEDWCARVRNSQGFICLPCGRYYRNCGTLRRHADEYHKKLVPLEIKKVVENPYCFSTTLALDAANFPYVCSSCQLVCFSSWRDLRRHEDWCGQCVYAKDGWKCEKCTRYFRTPALLELHTVADDCLKTDTATEVVSDGKCTGGTESEHLHGNIKQKAISATNSHGVCPLCDIPFMSQYERQVHFTHIHNLTSSELKIKQPVQRNSRHGIVRAHVTCLDCDLTFSTRLELVQHKRICTKDKTFTKVIVPVAPPAPASDKNRSKRKKSNSYSIKDESALEKEDSPKAVRVAASGDTSGKDAAKFDEQRECKVTEPLYRTQLSRGLLLNTTKVRSMIRRTGAKQLLLKPDGELLLLGDGGQKISTISGKPVTAKFSGNRGKPENGSTSEFSEKPKESLLRGLASDQSAQKSPAFSPDLVADKCNVNEGVSLASEKTELLDSKQDAEVDLKPCGPEFNQTVLEQCQISQHSEKVASESKSETDCAPKKSRDVDEQPKLTRKPSLQNVVSTSDIADPKNCAVAQMGHEVKGHTVTSGATKQEKPVLKNTRSKKLAEVKHYLVQKSADQPPPYSESEVRATESSSEAVNGQQSLLAALQLVPVSAQLKQPRAVSARYQTRSSVHAHLGKDDAVKTDKSDTKDVAASSSQERVDSSSKTLDDGTVVGVKRKVTDVAGKSVPRNTRTVEPIGTSIVQCVACKTIFRTVPQIVVHNCAG